jgi:hypothetical protein
LQDSLNNAGSKVTVIEVSKGTSLEKAVDDVRNAKADSGLVVMMFQSRYDIGLSNREYGYHFELIVLDRQGKTLARKTFRDLETKIELSSKYNLFDFMSEIYKRRFESFLNDAEIKNALTAAASGT